GRCARSSSVAGSFSTSLIFTFTALDELVGDSLRCQSELRSHDSKFDTSEHPCHHTKFVWIATLEHRMAIIRKTTGNFLEDFRLGQLLRHKVGKTVTEGLFNAFTEFSMTTNPLHKNRRYAQAYGYRDMILPPGLVMSVVFSQSVEDISENARVNLEYVDMRF